MLSIKHRRPALPIPPQTFERRYGSTDAFASPPSTTSNPPLSRGNETCKLVAHSVCCLSAPVQSSSFFAPARSIVWAAPRSTGLLATRGDGRSFGACCSMLPEPACSASDVSGKRSRALLRHCVKHPGDEASRRPRFVDIAPQVQDCMPAPARGERAGTSWARRRPGLSRRSTTAVPSQPTECWQRRRRDTGDAGSAAVLGIITHGDAFGDGPCCATASSARL